MNLQQCGIIERPSYSFESFSDSGYTIITTGFSKDEKDVYISLENPKDYKTSITQLLRSNRL